MAVVMKTLVSKLVLVVVLCPLLKSKSSFFDIEELQKFKYGVEINSEPVLIDQDAGGNTIHITSKHGQKYQCVLPILHVDEENDHSRNITTDQIRILLEPFNGTCSYLHDGWWTYEVCFGRNVSQYHEEGPQIKDNINLGHYAGDTDWSLVTIEKNPSNKERYHSQFYSNGTTCDLTGKLRKTEVRFFCDVSRDLDHIARIEESSTCVYIITVYTNKLCNHSLFHPARFPKIHSITCSPALMEGQFKTYSESKTEAVKDCLNGNSGSDNSEKVEDKPKKRTPSIFEALAKLFDKGVREKGAGGDNERIDWEDVFKTSRSAIDKSVERIRNLKLPDKKLQGDEADDVEDLDAEATSEVRMQSMKGEEPISNDYLYKIAKEKSSRKSEYYQQLIEGLKIQYGYFKKQMEIVTNDMHKKVKRLENSPGNAVGIQLVERIKATVQRFEEYQRTLDSEMKRLTDLNDDVAENPNYLTAAKDQIAGIRKRLNKLMEKLIPERGSLNDNDETEDMDEQEAAIKDEKNDKGESDIKGRQDKIFDMKSPRLDKVVSKLKNIMMHEGNEDLEDGEKENGGDDMFDDDRISVRVTKIKNKEEDLFDDTDESLYVDDNDKELKEINGNQEMKDATRKMESIVRKKLREAGIKYEGKVKVKIITSKEALMRVAGGRTGFQILTPYETNEFKDLLSNLLGGSEQLVKEKERQDRLEDNYNLIWRQDGFTSAKKDYSTTDQENSEQKPRT